MPDDSTLPLIDEYDITTCEIITTDGDVYEREIETIGYTEERDIPHGYMAPWYPDDKLPVPDLTTYGTIEVEITISDESIGGGLGTPDEIRFSDDTRGYAYTFAIGEWCSVLAYRGALIYDAECTTMHFDANHPFSAYMDNARIPNDRQTHEKLVDCAYVSEQYDYVTMEEIEMDDHYGIRSDNRQRDAAPDDVNIEAALEDADIDAEAILDEIDVDVEEEMKMADNGNYCTDIESLVDDGDTDPDDGDDTRTYGILDPLSDEGLRDNEYAVQIGAQWYAVDIGQFTPQGFKNQFYGKPRPKIEQHPDAQIVSEITLDSSNQWQYESAVDDVSSDTDSAYTYECTMPDCGNLVKLDAKHDMIRHECQTCGKTTQFEYVT